MNPKRFLSLVLGVALAWPLAVAAQCTSESDVTAVRNGLRTNMRCLERAISGRPVAVCRDPLVPACAGSLVDDAVRLAYGSAIAASVDRSRPDARDAYRCQRRLARAVEAYVGRRLHYLVAGMSPAASDEKARPVLAGVARSCAVPVANMEGAALPSVGPQCAAALAGSGPIDAAALQGCVHALLRRWTDRQGPHPQALRPNIILILSDDQRWDTVDATHAPAGESIMPKLRAELGDSGVQFTDAFMTTPLCCPSRSSLLRGQYAHTTGVHSNTGEHGGAGVFDDSVSLGTLLQSAGYRTGFYGKYLNEYNKLWTGSAPPYVPPGWNEWHVFKNPQYFNYTLVRNGEGYDHVQQPYGAAAAEYSTDVLRELAKQFIESSVSKGSPFFLYLAPKAPHLPRQPAPRHAGKYAGLRDWRPSSFNEAPLLVADMPLWVQNTARLGTNQRDDIDATRISQLEMLQAVDEMIGGSTAFGIEGLMPLLRRLGIADQTLVVYMSDNGYMWGEHRQTAKNKPYEEAIRAPLFVRYPPLAPLKRVDQHLVLNIDLCPTFSALAGVERPALAFDGHSLERVLDGTAATWRSDFITEGWALGREWVSVREAQWKYIETTDSRVLPLPAIEYELYDVVTDPLEQNNVVNFPVHSERVARMAARLRELRPAWPQDAKGDPEDEE